MVVNRLAFLFRICHYPLILRELTKYLPPEADAVKWKEAIVRLESTATTVNINKADAKKIEKLLEIEKKIEHLEVLPHLIPTLCFAG